MKSCSESTGDRILVGDPVDVVTGACVETSFEFELPGPLPLLFRRHYDSARVGELLPLGWGHTHELDHALELDIDGASYRAPDGRAVVFRPTATDGARCEAEGYVLRRLHALRYDLTQPDQSVLEFAFLDPSWPARPSGLRSKAGRIALRHDPRGRLDGIVDSLGRRIRIETTLEGFLGALEVELDAASSRRLLTLRYDGAGHLIEGTDAYGHSFAFAYDEQHRMVSKTDRRGYTFHYEYDAKGRCIHSRGDDGLHEVRLRYLPAERVTIVTKADGGEWTYLYDERGVVQKIIEPYGAVRRFVRDAAGRLSAIEQPVGTTRIRYSAGGARIGFVSPIGVPSIAADAPPPAPSQALHRVPSTPLEWELGELLLRDDITLPPHDAATLHSLPAHVRSHLRTQPPPPTRERAAREESAPPPPAGVVRDDLGLRIGMRNGKGATRRWTYDAGGNIQRYHDYDGGTESFAYVSWDLCSRKSDALGNEQRFTYTSLGRLASFTDAGGTSTDYTYDLRDRLVGIRRHGEARDIYEYDQADHLVRKRDGRGRTLLDLEIGAQGLPVVRTLASGERHEMSYDRMGRYASLAAEGFTVEFAYDRFGHRTTDERDGLGVRHHFTAPRTLCSTTVLGRFTTQYLKRGDRLEIRDPGGGLHRVHTGAHGVVRRTLANGSEEVSQYDSEGRCLLKSRRSRRSAQASLRTYEYSGEGDLLSESDGSRAVVRYEYDAAHRLVRAESARGSERFDYDAAGNVIGQPGLEGVILRDGNRLHAANGETFEYDDRDNVCARRGTQSREFGYDSRDMLTSIRSADGEWRAVYDPLGRRVRKSWAGHHVEFYHDTDRLAAEVHDGRRVRVYVYADAFALVPFMFLDYDGIDADPASGKSYFVFTNHLGVPIQIEDAEGYAVWDARISPYGAASVSSPVGLEFALRFPGHYFDAESGLHYNRFRYYDPTLARYVQPDPLGIGGSWNVYAYPASPLRQVDVRGDCPGDPPDSGSGKSTEGHDDKERTPQERAGYPSRSDESDAAAQRVLDAINAKDADGNYILSADERRRMVTVLVMDDGHVAVGVSGDASKVQPTVDHLRDTLGPGHTVGDPVTVTPAPNARDADGNPYEGGSQCSEPRAFNGAAEHNEERRKAGQEPATAQSQTTVWSPGPTEAKPEGKPLPARQTTTPAGSNYPDPCPSCRDPRTAARHRGSVPHTGVPD